MRSGGARGLGVGVTAVGAIVVGAYVVGMGWAAERADGDLWGALVVAPILVAITVPLARHAARLEDDPRMAQLIILALAAKLLGAVIRYYLIIDLYGSHSDAAVYATDGTRLAEFYRQGIFTGLYVPKRIPGTGFMHVLTGLVFAVTGPTRLGGFLVFSWFGFWGLYFFYRAFRVGVPDGDHRRYALLVFFLPSLLFWPSSIGKESWMMLALGVSAYGAARVLSSRPGGYVALGLGLVVIDRHRRRHAHAATVPRGHAEPDRPAPTPREAHPLRPTSAHRRRSASRTTSPMRNTTGMCSASFCFERTTHMMSSS